jgi:hypothetical protein
MKKQKSQIKSKTRVSEKGEVFTNEREVNAMLDLVKQETQRIDSRFLEPACGDGNFLIEIIRRKMEIIKKKYKKSQYDFERNSLIAFGSIYGIEIMQDNTQAGRNRLYKFFEKLYKRLYKETWKQEMLDSIKFILDKNIVWANGLTMMTMETDEKESTSPIVFSEWSLFGMTLIRRDFEFKDLIKKGKEKVYIPTPIKEYSYENHLGIGEKNELK